MSYRVEHDRHSISTRVSVYYSLYNNNSLLNSLETTITFTSAAEFNHGRIVELLLEIGADVEARDTAEMTPFLLAVTHAASHSVQVLLDNGADKTAVDSSLNSCLHLAISYCKTEMVKILLGKDKDKLLQLKDKNLNTVFHFAAGKKDSEVGIHAFLSFQTAKTTFISSIGVRTLVFIHLYAQLCN